jgi:hypothetical protein
VIHVRHGRTGAADARTRHAGANAGAADTGRNTGKANAGSAAGAADTGRIARASDAGITDLIMRNGGLTCALKKATKLSTSTPFRQHKRRTEFARNG